MLVEVKSSNIAEHGTESKNKKESKLYLVTWVTWNGLSSS